jgi:threonine synthase
MTIPASTLACAGCGASLPSDSAEPFACPARGTGDVDHVVGRTLDPSRVRFPLEDAEPNPFVRYRALSHGYQLAMARGMSDAAYVDLVRALDAEVAKAWGTGFVETPLGRHPALDERVGAVMPGGVWVKDETRNVSGSHKARHLMGIALFVEVTERTGLAKAGAERPLAIASCGNAALAAAVVARAWNRRLDVFIPPDANPRVVAKLESLGARIAICKRTDATPPGDPCYHGFRDAIAKGAVPFCCQGPDNGLTIDGGATIGYELVSQLAASGVVLDRLFVQVGGGALASAVVSAFRDAEALGVPVRLPRLHAVQTLGAYPLSRAYGRLAARIAKRLGLDPERDGVERALKLRGAAAPVLAEELAWAATHRSELMWPWEEEPKSVAHGILDDETYDWLAIVRGMLEGGGHPVVVDEATLVDANALGRDATGIDADETGTSGFAGLVDLAKRGVVATTERCGVIFSGVRR